jgi:putative ABC transport system permease protein
VVAGTDFAAVRRLDSWWQVDAWPDPAVANAALLGQRAAQFVGNEHAVALTYAGHTATLQGAGRIKTGGDEDSRIYMPLAAFTAWTGVGPSVIEVQVPGGARRVEVTMAKLQGEMPEVQVQPVRQLVEGESKIVDRTHALMTALGGSQGQLMGMFLLEALVLAVVGVAVGFVVGSAAAWAISEGNFHTAALPHLSVLPLVLLLNVAIAAMAALLPVRVLRGLQPAALLKGE